MTSFIYWDGGSGRHTGCKQVESITKVSLVTHEVQATFGLVLLLHILFILGNFRAKGDTATKNNVGVLHVRIVCYIHVSSRTHLANVSCNCKGTIGALRIGMSVIEVVCKGILRLRLAVVKLNRGPCKLSVC